MPTRPTSYRHLLRTVVRRRETQLAVLLLVLFAYAGATSPYFFTSTNIFNLSSGIVEIAMIAFPLALIIITSEIDISVESMMGLSGAVFGHLLMTGVPFSVAFVASIIVGAVGGLLNGWLVTEVGLPSLVVTLGTYALYRGLAFVILSSNAVSSFPAGFTDFTQGYINGTPIPLTFIPLAVLAMIVGFILHFTRFGRQLYFTGMNSEAARLAGVRTTRLKILLFMFAGTISALAGIFLAGRLSSARADNGSGFVLDILTIVLLGGVVIAGGEGTVIGVILSIAVVATLRNAMTLANVDSHVQTTLVGVLLIVAVASPYAQRLLRERRARRPLTEPSPTTSVSTKGAP